MSVTRCAQNGPVWSAATSAEGPASSELGHDLGLGGEVDLDPYSVPGQGFGVREGLPGICAGSLLSDGSADVDAGFHRPDRFGAGQEDPIAWVTALRAPAIKKLAADGGPLQMTLFDQQDLTRIAHRDYPGERLAACRIPLGHHRVAAAQRSPAGRNFPALAVTGAVAQAVSLASAATNPEQCKT